MLARAMPANASPTNSGRTPISLARNKLKVGSTRAPTNTSATAAPTPTPVAGDSDASYVTPLVRKLAKEHGVELASLNGTGVGGRIRKQDVLAAAEAAKQEAEAAKQAAAAPAQAPAQPAVEAAPAAAAVQRSSSGSASR